MVDIIGLSKYFGNNWSNPVPQTAEKMVHKYSIAVSGWSNNIHVEPLPCLTLEAAAGPAPAGESVLRRQEFGWLPLIISFCSSSLQLFFVPGYVKTNVKITWFTNYDELVSRKLTILDDLVKRSQARRANTEE